MMLNFEKDQVMVGSFDEKKEKELQKMHQIQGEDLKKFDQSFGVWDDLKEGILSNKASAALSLGLVTLLSVGIGLTPLVSGKLSSYLQAQSLLSAVEVTAIGAVYLCMCPVLEGVVNWVHGAMMKVTSFFQNTVKQHIKVKNSERFFKMPSLFRKKQNEKKLSSIADEMANASSSILAGSFQNLSSILMLVTTTATLFMLSPVAGLGVMGLMGGKLALNRFTTKKLAPLQNEIQKIEAENAAFQRDVTANIDNIRSRGSQRENDVLCEMAQNNASYATRLKKLEKKREFYNAINSGMDILFSCMFAFAAFSSFQVHKDVGLYMTLTGAAYRSMYSGSNFVRSIKSISENVQKYIGSKELLQYDERENVKEGEKDLGRSAGRISLKEIDFAYSRDDETLFFDKLNLEIMPGQKVAIVGKSGSGKSTLLSLLARKYEIQGGSFEIDGNNVQELTYDSIAKNISSFIGDSYFFETKSLSYNLRHYKKDASEKEMAEALKKVGLGELLDRQEGLDALVEGMSSGQQQRLLLAGLCLSETPIILLDEITSRLDPETRRDVLETLDIVFEGKTVIYSSHSEGEIARADKAIVMENGSIVESGTPYELIQQQDSQFYHLFSDYVSVFEKQDQRKKLSSLKNTKDVLNSFMAINMAREAEVILPTNPMMIQSKKKNLQYQQAQKQFEYGKV